MFKEPKLDEEARLEREREEEPSKAANIAEWDDVQAMMDAHSEEQRRKPPTKTQKRNIMSTYLKNMAGYKHTQLKNKSFEQIQMLFEKEMKRVNIFVDMDAELVKGKETREESGSKRAGDELEQESSKRQKVDDDDKEREDLKECFEIISDEEFVVHVIPLAVNPAPIVAMRCWKPLERATQGESLNVQDVKTNLFWKFRKFTSRDGESIESYYSRFYKLMNELTRNNLQVITMQVNVQFLQQLQPEWSRFVTVVKQSKEIDTISYHTLFDILKQYQNEVNDIRADRIAKSANPLALLAAAQPYSDNYYQAPKPQRTNTTSSSTRLKDSDPEQAQRDKDMQKNLALLEKNKTEDTTPRYNNDNQSLQFGNQRTMTVDGARETVGSQECRKPKRVKDYSYHKEKMMMCKQAEHGVPLQVEQADWLADTDEEIDEQELEAHYSFMAKIQEVLPEESCSTEQPLEQQLKKANASLTQEMEEYKTNIDKTNRALRETTSCRDSCLIALQNKQNEFEKYKAFNDRTIDYDILQTKLNETLGLLALKDIEIKEGLKTKAYEISVLNQKHDELVKKSLLTKSQLEGRLKEKTKFILDLKVKEEKDIDKMIEMDKQLKFLNKIVYTHNQLIQTIHMLAPKCSTYNGRPTFANPRYLKKAQSKSPACMKNSPYNLNFSCKTTVMTPSDTVKDHEPYLSQYEMYNVQRVEHRRRSLC
ncbi:hypothetical protein Tco_1041705 [Tanacetum coccineum]|uniref:Gag-Pol polyprotein n=1 Tax=Tanacetum coccineum TaxID=301880 RepID=A0ABQ5GHI3_9ASTR